MATAIYPGSFDPITNGHLDIIERTMKFVDKLILGVLDNPSKKQSFTVLERIEQIKIATNAIPNIEIKSFNGLLVDFAKSLDVKIVIRGLRTVTDFENEFKMALINRTLNSDIETLFISASTEYMYLSSSAVKEIAYFGGDIDNMVHPYIKEQIYLKFNKK